MVEWSTPDCCASWRCDIFLTFSCVRSHSLKARPLRTLMWMLWASGKGGAPVARPALAGSAPSPTGVTRHEVHYARAARPDEAEPGRWSGGMRRSTYGATPAIHVKLARPTDPSPARDWARIALEMMSDDHERDRALAVPLSSTYSPPSAGSGRTDSRLRLGVPPNAGDRPTP